MTDFSVLDPVALRPTLSSGLLFSGISLGVDREEISLHQPYAWIKLFSFLASLSSPNFYELTCSTTKLLGVKMDSSGLLF